MRPRGAPRSSPLTRAQIENLSKGNPRVAQRASDGHYDDRLDDPAGGGEPTDSTEALIAEIEGDPGLAERLSDALSGTPPRPNHPDTDPTLVDVLVDEIGHDSDTVKRLCAAIVPHLDELVDVLVDEIEHNSALGGRLASALVRLDVALGPHISDLLDELADADIEVGAQRSRFMHGLLTGAIQPEEAR